METVFEELMRDGLASFHVMEKDVMTITTTNIYC